MKIEFVCLDGFAGASYDIYINGVNIPVTINSGDDKKAITRAAEILKALEIDYDKEIVFKRMN